MSLLWTLFSCVAIFFGIVYGLTVYRLTNARINYMGGSVVDDDTVPLYLRDLYKLAAGELEGLGFQDCGYLENTPFFQIPPFVRWAQVFVDSSGRHFATIDLRYPVNARDPFIITFHTWFEGDYLSITCDRQAHGVIQPMLDAMINDYRLRDLEQRWNYHCQQSAKIDRQIKILDIHSFNLIHLSHSRRYLDNLVAKKIVIYVEESNNYRLAIPTIFNLTYSVIFKAPKAQPLAKPIELPPEIVSINSQQLEYLQRSVTKPHRKLWWFALSAIGFYLATLPYNGWQVGIQLSFIILFHELGHLVGMKLCGYRDTRMLFVPFFGGFVTGKNDEATLWQKFWVAMLGPLPGILLGLLMLLTSDVYSPWYWGHGFGLLTIGINLLNLLPIYPLDGGRIVGLLLQPYPYVGIIFKIICAAILILVGLAGEVLFLLVGIALVASIPLELKVAKAIDVLKVNPGDRELGKEEWIKWAQELLGKNLQLPVKPIDQKNLMNSLWEWRLGLPDRLVMRSVLSLIYLIIFLGSTIVGGYGLFNRNFPKMVDGWVDDFKMKDMTAAKRQEYLRQKQQQELAENNKIVEREPNNIKAYQERLRLHVLLKDERAQLADLDRLVIIAPDPVPNSKKRYVTSNKLYYLERRLHLKDELGLYESALADADRLMQMDSGSNYRIYLVIGDIHAKLGRTDLAISSYTKYIDREQTSDSPTYIARVRRSELYQQAGKDRLALADLNMAISVYPKYAKAYQERAKLRDRLGDKKGANSDRQMANKIEAESAKEEGEE
jgi:tetratricopeptide (TPR) repeat protein/Zn-dependent protease